MERADAGMRSGRDVAAIVLLVAVTLVQLGLAWTWPLLADEAYYRVWAAHPALGYYDQPPLIAWMLAVSPPGALGARLLPILCGVLGPVALWRAAPDRLVLVAVWVGALPLAWLTFFATPDAPLLAAWAGCLGAAIAGGRWWLFAGVCAAAATLSKHSGLAVFPLCVVATGDRDRWVLGGALLWLGLLAPHGVWLATHELVTVRFQAHEGLGAGFEPVRPVTVYLRDQLALLGPVLAVGMAVWAARWPRGRAERVAYASLVPVAVFFFAAAAIGVPEAHWPAPAWVGGSLALSLASRGLRRAALVGAGWGALGATVLATHLLVPWLPLEPDPRDRFAEGPVLAREVVARLPQGAVVRTERYQEASFLQVYAGIDARRRPGCGRPDQFDLWPAPAEPDTLWLLRPRTSGPELCTDATYPRRLATHEIEGRDASGEVVGRWQLYHVAR